MTNYQRLVSVRLAITAWLAKAAEEEGSEAVDHEITRESILVRDEFYCGHRLSTPTHRAVWFIEEDELKIYSHKGETVVKLVGKEIDQAAEFFATPQKSETSGAEDASRDTGDSIRATLPLRPLAENPSAPLAKSSDSDAGTESGSSTRRAA